MKATEIERQLDAVRDEIADLRLGGTRGKELISKIVSDLANVPTKYAAMIEAVNALPSSPYNDAQKARFTTYAAEFSALNTAAQATQASLASVTEF